MKIIGWTFIVGGIFVFSIGLTWAIFIRDGLSVGMELSSGVVAIKRTLSEFISAFFISTCMLTVGIISLKNNNKKVIYLNFQNDINDKIKTTFKKPDIIEFVIDSLLDLSVSNDTKLFNQVVRCILILSKADPGAIVSWVSKANIDYSAVVRFAEFDNRNIRMYNFKLPFNKQKKYKMGE